MCLGPEWGWAGPGIWLCNSREAAAAAKSLQLCPTLCDPIDGSPLGSSVPGILQARILEWVAIFFSNVWMWKVKVNSLSHARLLATPWTPAYQAPRSMGFFQARVLEWVPLPSPCEAVVSVFWDCSPCKPAGQRKILFNLIENVVGRTQFTPAY